MIIFGRKKRIADQISEADEVIRDALIELFSLEYDLGDGFYEIDRCELQHRILNITELCGESREHLRKLYKKLNWGQDNG